MIAPGERLKRYASKEHTATNPHGAQLACGHQVLDSPD
jgi:hypothetical protein